MSALDTIFNILKGAHPDASDEDIHSYIDSAKATPDQMSAAASPFDVSSTGTAKVPLQAQVPTPTTAPAPSAQPDPSQPDLTLANPPDMSLNIPDANSVKSNFDVNTSDNTVTQNGSAPSVTNQPGQVPPPVTPNPETPPVAAAPSASAPDSEDDSSDSSKGAKGGNEDAAIKAALSAPSDKSAAQADLDAKNHKLKMTGALSGLAGGIGDAIGNAAIPFGGKGSSGTQEQINENTNAQVDKNKATFAEQQKKDPNSDISKHYQKVLGLMLGSHAQGMGVEKMSAEQIASTLPEVEKYMQKELGLKQIQSNKELSMAMHEQGRQDKLEKDAREWVDNLSKARNGEIGVQNAKVDQARHLLQVFKQAEETGKPIPNAQYGELAIGAANLVAGGAQNVSDHTRQMIMQSTAKGDMNKALTWAGFDPSTLGGSTDSVLQNLKKLIGRQGYEAELQRDKFINDQKKFIPSGLDPAKTQKLLDANFGNSIKEFLPQNKAHSTPNAGAVPVVSDQQTYDRLPSGASYQDANGKTYRKK